MTDPIADMLTRLRNGLASGKDEIRLPHSKLKGAVAKLLAENGYLAAVKVEKDDSRLQLVIQLPSEHLVNAPITEIKRLSRPGRRLYVKATKIPTVKRGRGLVVVSTSQGIMSGQTAKAKQLGGELICEVY